MASYISSVVVTFSSENDSSLLTTSICLDHVAGCTILNAMNFINKSPVVKSCLRNKYQIIGFIFKYTNL